jgi:hypothetical protein
MPSRPPRAYIDACYYVDVAKGHDRVKIEAPGREEDLWWVQQILTAALNRDVEIIASTLLIAECLHVGDGLAIPDEAKDTFRRLLTGGQVFLVAPDVFIAERARDLLWVHGVNCGGGADALHVATALEMGCEEFLTVNKNRGPANATAVPKLAQLGLRVIDAPRTSLLPDNYRPQGLIHRPWHP